MADDFFLFLTIAAVCVAVLVALFLILLALPASRLRGLMLTIVNRVATIVMVMGILYVINPFDLPGPVDDAGAFATAVFSGIAKVVSAMQAKSNQKELEYRPPAIDVTPDPES